MADGNKPARTFRVGLVSATVWKNDSNSGFYYSVRLSRRYKDNADVWQDTYDLSHSDLLNAAKVLERAERFIAEEAR